MRWISVLFALLMGLGLGAPARAEQPWTFSNNTRYLALGDSLAAGYGAIPTTQGYAYLLYQQGVYARTTGTVFANAAVPGVTSTHVLQHQLPQANVFQPHVVTLSVGGNDLLQILSGADPAAVLGQFAANLVQILCGLQNLISQPRVYIHNLYDIPEITSGVPGGLQAIQQFNGIVAGVAAQCGAVVADVYSAFEGRTGLLLIERHGAGLFEVHPTNAGYREIAAAFKAVRQ